MARSVPAAVFDSIVEEVARHPDGVGIDALARALPAIPRRTLQRHLARLASGNRIRVEGMAAARRYRVFSADTGAPAVVERPGTEEAWMSAAGAEVKRLVRRPLGQRKPVGRRTFLDGYRPNVDAYLPAPTRNRLHELGRSPDGGRPAGTSMSARRRMEAS